MDSVSVSEHGHRISLDCCYKHKTQRYSSCSESSPRNPTLPQTKSRLILPSYNSSMGKSRILRSCTYITSFLSAVHGFSFTLGNDPTQCDNLAFSWTGKHLSTTCIVLLLNSNMIVRWTSTVSNPSDCCSSALFFQAHRLCADPMPPRLINPCLIYLYHHQHSAITKAHIQYPNFHSRPKYSF